jgi:hypothetical protein
MVNTEVFYSTENKGPIFPSGIGVESRTQALAELKRHLGGFEIPPGSFMDISPLVASLGENRMPTEELIKIISIWHNPNHPFFTEARQRLAAFQALELPREAIETCPYRDVTAFSHAIAGEYFVAAVGNSGGHEFLHLESEDQIQFLTEAILEASLIANLEPANDDWQIFFEQIRNAAGKMLARLKIERPLVPTPNCIDLTRMAINLVGEICRRNKKELTPELGEYFYCTMNKAAIQFLYESAGLTSRGMAWRDRCLSVCAETQSLHRLKHAVNIPIYSGHNDATLIMMRKGVFVDNGVQIPTTQYYFLDKNNVLRRLTVDRRISYNPLSDNPHPQQPRVAEALLDHRIDSRQHNSLFISLDSSIQEIVVSIDRPGVHRAERVNMDFRNSESIARFHRNKIQYLPVPGLEDVSVFANGLPCLFCATQMHRFPVTQLLISELDLSDKKGDDGLVLEALAKRGCQVSIDKLVS